MRRLVDENGALQRVVGTAADITEARMAHEALGKTQRLLASIVYSSQDAIVGQSLDGRITTWNPAAEGIFGYSQDEAVGALASILLTDKQDSEALEILARVKQG